MPGLRARLSCGDLLATSKIPVGSLVYHCLLLFYGGMVKSVRNDGCQESMDEL
jgi:hypothetical protein